MFKRIALAAACLVVISSTACASDCQPTLHAARAAHPHGHIRWNHGCFYLAGNSPHRHGRAVPAARPTSAPKSAMAAVTRDMPQRVPVPRPSPVRPEPDPMAGPPADPALADIIPRAVHTVAWTDSFTSRWAPVAAVPAADQSTIMMFLRYALGLEP